MSPIINKREISTFLGRKVAKHHEYLQIKTTQKTSQKATAFLKSRNYTGI